METLSLTDKEVNMIRYGLMGEMKLIRQQLKKAIKSKNLDDVETFTKALESYRNLLDKITNN